ncbi:MAG: Gp15 family bacteriophage protein [Roseburia sp.]|nr:Gp15 family bacteriophage protein [Roseburia sp.]
MNVLMDNLPDTVVIAGEAVPINTDYRTGILVEQSLNDPLLSDDEKLVTLLRLYYGEDVFQLFSDMDTVKEALDRIKWFYQCGTDEQTEDSGGDPYKEPPFSYEYDAAYIYAAFVEAYGIDLTENRLHWWQFRALFLGLPEDVQFCKIMGYRTMEIPPKMPKDRKKFYQKMKRIYKLPESAVQIRLDKELNDILENGGDISQLMK